MPNQTFELAHWINERESIRLRREANVPAPWTADPVMASVRFCNVHREDDKVTRYLRNSPVYSGVGVPLWVSLLARMVNRIPTLDVLEGAVKDRDFQEIKDVMKDKRSDGTIVWGNAYTVSTCGKTMDKVDYMVDEMLAKLRYEEEMCPFDYTSLHMAAAQFTRISGLGSFMAGQLIADLKNTPGHTLQSAHDWHSWSTHGPGSLLGLTEYFGKPVTPRTYQQAISKCHDEVMQLVHSYVGDIHMQDLQNCMCEFSKYMRVKGGKGHARNSYPPR